MPIDSGFENPLEAKFLGQQLDIATSKAPQRATDYTAKTLGHQKLFIVFFSLVSGFFDDGMKDTECLLSQIRAKFTAI